MASSLLTARYPEIKNPDRYYRILCDTLSLQENADILKSFSPVEWKQFETIATGEQVDKLLYWLWKNNKVDYIPDELMLRFRDKLCKSAARQKLLYKELSEHILPALAPFTIVILKGGALARDTYANEALRPMADIDLFVRKDQFDEIIKRMTGIGYTFAEHNVSPGPIASKLVNLRHARFVLKKPISICVEIHHSLLIDKSEWYIQQNEDWFWDNIELFSIDKQSNLYRLSPTAQLIHLSSHLILQHGEGQMTLLKYFDIHQLIMQHRDRMDWEELRNRVRLLDRSAVLYNALFACQTRFSTPLPDGFLASLQLAETPKLIAEQIEKKKLPQSKEITNYWYLLQGKLPWMIRLRLLWELTFPVPGFLCQVYRPEPEWIWPLYYFVRIYRTMYYGFKYIGQVLERIGRRFFPAKGSYVDLSK